MYLEKNRFYKHLDFIILDIICMELSFIASYYLRHLNFDLFESSYYRASLIFLIVANIISNYLFNTMHSVLKRSKQLEFYATFKQVAFVTILLIIYLFITKTSSAISRNTLINFPIIYIIISYIARLFYKNIVKNNINSVPSRQFVIITKYDKAKNLIDKINSTINDIAIKGIIIIDYLSDDSASLSDKKIEDIPIVAFRDNAIKYLKNEFVDEILISNYDIDVSELMEKISLMGIIVHYDLQEISKFTSDNSKLSVSNISDIVVLTSSINVINPLQLFVKRIVDIILGIIGTITTLILAVIIGPMIKAKSKGPIFFAQDRVGKNGRVFKMLKFRSMIVDADELKKSLLNKNDNSDDLMFKMKDDPRVIPGIGEFIRKTSIDEFPQFINVLIGDMSVVGTRPPTVDEWEKYELHHRARLAIKPGITGLWQVSGRSNIKSFEDVVKLDTQYIKTFSLWQDFSIILKTIKVVLDREGAR